MRALEHMLARSRLLELSRHVRGRTAADPGPIALVHRRVYILPTVSGFAFGLALLLMLVGSINYSLSLGYMLTFLLAGTGVVAMLHTYRNLIYLSASVGRAEPTFAGNLAQFHIHLDNPTHYERVSVRLRCAGRTETCDVAAHRGTTVTLGLPSTTRGWLPLPRLTIETRFPLGLLRAWGYAHLDMRALVYPRPDLAELPPPSVVPDSGDAISASIGSDDFFGLRSYQPSDSPRHVAWKAVARSDVLLTKTFTGLGAAEMWFDFDALPDMLDVEARLSRLTRWVLLAEDAGLVYGMRLRATVIGPATGDAHRDACLRALALFDHHA